MNAVVPTSQQQPQSFGLVPTTMAEAMKLAEMMAGAKLVPAALQKSPADCLMVIQQAIRWQMDPFAVAQECSVIQGKLMHSGKLVAAVINVRGNLADRLSFTYEGDGDNRAITVSGRVSGESEPRVVRVRLGDAKTANRVWQTQPDQQLMYHGSRVWARRHAPELMLGVWSPEEFDEPAPLASHAKRPPKPAANVMLPPHNAETGEIIEQPPQDLEQGAVDQPAPVSGVASGAGAGTSGETDILVQHDRDLTEAAARGTGALQEAWSQIPPAHKPTLKSALDRRHKPSALEADKARLEQPV